MCSVTTFKNSKSAKAKKPDAYKDYRKILERKDIDAVMIANPRSLAYQDMRRSHVGRQRCLLRKTFDADHRRRQTDRENRQANRPRFSRLEPCSAANVLTGFYKRSTWSNQAASAQLKKSHVASVAFSPSPKIPVVDVPKGLDWDFWLGPAPKVPYRALPEMRTGYGGGVPLYSNCHYAFRNWHEYSGGILTDWGAHHVDIACWAIGASDTGPSSVRPMSFEMAVRYKDGNPTVDDQYNVATKFKIRAQMPNDIELWITNEGDNGVLFEGTKGRFFVNRGKIVGKPIEDLASNPLPDGAIEEVYGGPVPENHSVNFIQAMQSRKKPISDVWTHNRMLEICHLSNIAMRLDRELRWDPVKREIIGDEQATSFMSRENRKGYEIDM